MSAAPVPEKDPRNRPYRMLVLGLYLVFSVGFSLLVAGSVVRSVATMSPGRKPSRGAAIGQAECVGQAQAFFAELEARRKGLADAKEPVRADLDWVKFRNEWVTRLRELEGRCGVDAPGRESLKAMFQSLEATLDTYTTHATQFSSQVGPTLTRLREAFEAAGR